MREIKFRGYSKEIGKWIYGCLLKCWSKVEEDFVDDDPMMVSQNNYNYYEVDKVSVGQYTGFKDKNGREIYEGDIVKWWNEKCIVEFDAGKWLAKKMTSNRVIRLFNELSHIEVIGNTYEKKLKEEK